MQTTYAQKNETAQRAADNTAAAVHDNSPQSVSLQRHASLANAAVQRAENPPRPNNTGLPDDLKNGVESLSGYSLDNVRVHYNSPKPATVQALAYTQGTDIHVAPGQEHALPHEAWHVTQQMAGRVTPTTNIGGMPVNDNAALEHEADVMGEKAVTQRMMDGSASALKCVNLNGGSVQRVAHIYPTGNEITVDRPNGCAAESELLPKIAFETLAGGSRAEDELSDLYQNELTRYTGIAEVFMGVNFEAKILGKDESGKVAAINDAKSVADNLAKKVKAKINGPLTQPQQTQTQKSGTQQPGTQQKVPHKVTIYPFAWSEVGSGGSDYRFPFYEARSLLMKKASDCGADLFRWIDSDVRKDASITKLNTPGYYGGINMPKIENLQIYSGYYNWDVERIYKDDSKLAEDNDQIPLKDGKTMTCSAVKTGLDKLNPREKQLREIFWKIKEMRGDTNFLAEEGYVPEPIVYMNKLAHDAAISHLEGGVKNHMKQDRESDKAFVNMPVKFMPDFSVSKPVKVSSSGKSYMGNADFKNYTDIRQSAFDAWSFSLKSGYHNLYEVIKKIIREDEDCKTKKISDFNIGDVGYSFKSGRVKVGKGLQKKTGGDDKYDVEVGEKAEKFYVKTIGGHLIPKGENINDLVNSLSENIVVKYVGESESITIEKDSLEKGKCYQVMVGKGLQKKTGGDDKYDVEVGKNAKEYYVKTIGGHLIPKGENINDLVNSLSENIVVKYVGESITIEKSLEKGECCQVIRKLLPISEEKTDFKFIVDENDNYYEVT